MEENKKDYKDLRIVFMGTPEFAVTSLEELIQAGCTIAGVITMPDKPAGRGMELQQSAVKKAALKHHLNILQPEKLKNPDFLKALQALNADLQICVAFRMLPEVVWNMPPMGTINLHGSLLPQYRGAAPINWAIINGEKETGVTTFKLQHAIDTGPILLQERFPIQDNDDAGTVHDKMKVVGAKVLLKTIIGLAGNTISEQPQVIDETFILRTAPKIFPVDCEINFKQTVENVYNHIRGLSPYPGAYTFLDNKKLKIFKTEMIGQRPVAEPGQYETDGKNYFRYACTDGYIRILELQLEGKKRMPVQDFLRGYKFQ